MSEAAWSALAEAARHFYARGWMAGTAGNLSLRHADGSVWITASGRHKGRLAAGDFLRLGLDGAPIEQGGGVLPSAETAIHLALYRLFPEARACYHVHSVAGNLASRLSDGDLLPLPPLEMLKGFGVPAEALPVAMPVFENRAEVARIAAEIERRFAAGPPPLPAFLIRDHGLTVWGESPEAAFNHIELAEFVFTYMVEARRLGL